MNRRIRINRFDQFDYSGKYEAFALKAKFFYFLSRFLHFNCKHFPPLSFPSLPPPLCIHKLPRLFPLPFMNTLSTCPLPCPLSCHLHFTCLPFQLLFPHLVTSLQVNKQLLHMMLPALNSSYTLRSPDPSLLSTPLPTLLLLFPFHFSTYSSLHQPPLPPYPFPPPKKYIVTHLSNPRQGRHRTSQG